MKTLTRPGKAFAATALAAGILWAGPAAMANDAPAPTQAATAEQVLDRAITLKASATGTISDRMGTPSVGGLPWLSANYPLNVSAPFPASGPIQAADGSYHRMISVERCGLPASAYFISDSLTATDQARTAATDLAAVQPLGDDASAYVSHFTGTGLLKPQAAIYDKTSDAAPLYNVSSDVLEVPMTAVYAENGKHWARVIAPGMVGAVVPASDIAGFNKTECLPNAALPFASEVNNTAYPTITGDTVHARMVTAATKAITARAGATELEHAQTGYSASGADVVAAVAEADEATGFQAPADVNVLVLAAVGILALLAAGVAAVVATVKAVRKYKAEEAGK